ncbi:MAG TPA: hypothetical protein DEP23_05980 [Ruminococcaceae bacterium]|nr:hypothetical protein [Oscillospiraceae bacterium]
MKKKKGHNGTQELIGIKQFSRNGLLTNRGELVFFVVDPTNISVLSQISITIKVRNLQQLLTAQPDVGILCMDDSANFDFNKSYLKNRIKEEDNQKVRALLQQDLAFLDEIQVSMSTARKFMFVVRLRNESEDQSFANLNRIEKVISEQGFDVKRATKSEIKRFLSIYFGRTALDNELPDFDGDQAYAQVQLTSMPEQQLEVPPSKWIISEGGK